MSTAKRYSPETWKRAVRLVLDAEAAAPTPRAALAEGAREGGLDE